MTQIIEGKYGSATVHTDNADETTLTQVKALVDSPAAENSEIHIMPDCHAGAGCVIGTTMSLDKTDKVVPNLVGVDIGCGVMVTKLPEPITDFAKFDKCVRTIPSGFRVNTWGQAEYNWDYSRISEPDVFLGKLKMGSNLKNTEHIARSLGTLGGGNHFIEVDQDEEGKQYLVIHSGSRNLGTQVAEHYQKLAIAHCRENGIEVCDDLAYLTGQNLANYLHDMRLCQMFAHENRAAMVMNILTEYFGHEHTPDYESWESVHNYINFDDNILRKGAISAKDGERCIIPMNMRDGSLICVGLGNEGWNQSAPHGAGRIYSRKQAKQNIPLEDYQKAMEGIYSTCVNENTLDESPMAYKPMEEIIKNIKGMNVEIVKIIKPVYNFKADDPAPRWMK